PALPSRSPVSLLAPMALLATAAVEVTILGRWPDYKPWLVPAVAVPAGLAAVALLVLFVRRTAAARYTAVALGVGLAALLLPTFVWSNSVLARSGNGTLPAAGPPGALGGFGGPMRNGGTPPAGAPAFRDDGAAFPPDGT